MQKLIALCCVLLCTHAAIAQEYFSVVHTTGTEKVADNYVNVTGVGNSSVKEFCNVSPFWIGNSNANSYEFAFTKPVSKILLHITALNKNEIIGFYINGVQHYLTESELSSFKTECVYRQGLLSIDGGRLAYKDESMGYTNAMVEIATREPIYTFAVKHINGQQNGVVFDLAYSFNVQEFDEKETEESKATSINSFHDGHNQLVLHPNPNNGKFFVKGNTTAVSDLELEIVNVIGQTIFKKNVSPNAGLVNESIELTNSFASGVYTLRLSDGQHIKFTVSR